MTKLRDYQSWKLKKLGNPIFAAHYLNEIERSSPELVLAAIKNVVRAREVSAVAKEAGVVRENIYRAFSEQGNPKFSTFTEVLKAVGVKIHFEPIIEVSATPTPPVTTTPLSMSGLNSSKLETINSDSLSSSGEQSFVPFLAYVNPTPPKKYAVGAGGGGNAAKGIAHG
jgi:probable addiction module antidote protein